ncbi:PAS domain-containing protein [Aromatoleum diolicum]|uniref:histidine kinase n=1 Tax=Aromatoleum diolicum TaxID=75796 RepID=A0ABX1Q8Y8_9RHOO|nr:PAS domain-containing protein [Aromatoleum diolicum]NMG74000.1 PAS domain-containing protein [Aromatoleum diolicum]
MSALQNDGAQSIRPPGEQAGTQPDGTSGADAPRRMPDELLHELRVHQVELERQNEALHNVRLSLEDARDRYVDLFEFAPVGYLTLTRQGTIDEINLTGTNLLGAERKQVLGRRFAHFVLPEDRDRWHVYLVDVAKHSGSRDCELRLLRGEGACFYARLNGIGVTSTADRIAVRITLTDISEQKRMEALNESELRLRMAMQAMSGGIYDWDRRTGSLYWSSDLSQVCGIAPRDFRPDRRWWRQRVHPEDLRLIRPVIVSALKTRTNQFQVEYRIRHEDGRWGYVADRGQIVRDATGRVVRVVGAMTDITASKHAEAALLRLNDALEEKVVERTAEVEARSQALAEAERFARATIDSLSSSLCVLDEQGRIIATNRTWREWAIGTGDRVARARGCQDCRATPFRIPCWSAETATSVHDAIQDLLARKRRTFSLEYECRAPAGSSWFEMHVTRFPGDGAVRLVVTHDEISERKRAAEDQKRTAERIKQLGLHLETLREQQSAMIARELHDELGATLTMLKLGLATTAEEVASSEPLHTKLYGLLEQADAALRVVKRVSSSLRPATLDTLGLIATIRWYVTQFSRNTGIATVLRLPEYVRLSQLGNTTVFRIIQEGLTNVAKHSGASKVTINARKHDGALIVRLVDNGSGITESDLQRPDSFGLMGMRERAEHLGGTLSIGSGPDKGTQLMLRIPLDS